jgi:hypothetical protein
VGIALKFGKNEDFKLSFKKISSDNSSNINLCYDGESKRKKIS